MSDIQKQVQQTIDGLVESGAERGLQVAVYQRGELVVDAVAGVADHETGRPMMSDTPVYAASTGKSLSSTVVHVLAERGVLGYDTPVVEYWPAYGAHGKAATTVRHVLTQSAGVPGVPPGTQPENLFDWDGMCAALADSEPWWEPGTQVGYHPQTYGYLVGEIVRRATGKPISEVLREEVGAPLGVADELYFGVSGSELGRLARLEEVGEPVDLAQLEQMMPLFFKAAPAPVQLSAELCNRPDFLTADIPAGGTMSARAVARVYAALLDDVDGVRLVSPERLREISAVAIEGIDQLFGMPTRYALGYSLDRPAPGAGGDVIGWPGAGGCHADADPATGTALAVIKNRFTPGDYATVAQISEVVTKALADG